MNPEIIENDGTPLFIGYELFEKKTILANENPSRGNLLGEVKVGSLSATPGANTGNGVLDQLAQAAGGPAKVGDWILQCVEAITNSGRFKLTDPDGLVIDANIVIPVSGNIVYVAPGLTFRLADGATDFALNDSFTITVAAGSGYLKKCVSTAFDGSEIPKYIAVQTLENASDVVQSVAIRCDVEAGNLVFEGSDDLDTLVHGKTIKDWLHERSIFAITAQHLNFPDNS